MADLESGGMVKKFHVALFLNKGNSSTPDWMRIKKSTDNTITMNPETRDLDFIVDEAPTTVIDKYKPSLSQPITMFKDEANFEFLFEKFFNQASGSNAETEVLIVFLNEKNVNDYKAWKCKALLIFDNMNPTESTITVNVNFNGTTATGTCIVTGGCPVFNEESGDSEVLVTVNVTEDGSGASGAFVWCNGIQKIADSKGNVQYSLIIGNTYVLGAKSHTTGNEGSLIQENFSNGVTEIELAIA